MKNIKHFKYKNTYEFNVFLKDYRYEIDDISGYSVGWNEYYNGNVLRVYIIYFNNGEYKLFRIVYFKSFNEYNQTYLGLNNNKLLSWYDSANIVKFKFKDIYGMDDQYIITDK